MVFNTQTCKYKGFSNHKGFTNGKVFANEKGFTIVELVIVIAVIGILAAVLIPTFNSIIKSSKESRAKQEIIALIKEYYIENTKDLDELIISYNFDDGSDLLFDYKDKELNIITSDYKTINNEILIGEHRYIEEINNSFPEYIKIYKQDLSFIRKPFKLQISKYTEKYFFKETIEKITNTEYYYGDTLDVTLNKDMFSFENNEQYEVLLDDKIIKIISSSEDDFKIEYVITNNLETINICGYKQGDITNLSTLRPFLTGLESSKVNQIIYANNRSSYDYVYECSFIQNKTTKDKDIIDNFLNKLKQVRYQEIEPLDYYYNYHPRFRKIVIETNEQVYEFDCGEKIKYNTKLYRLIDGIEFPKESEEGLVFSDNYITEKHDYVGGCIEYKSTDIAWFQYRTIVFKELDRNDPAYKKEITKDVDVYIANTMGELGLFYTLSDVAFVGGSLIKWGGHNPMEPARLHNVVLSGKYVHNFEIAGEYNNVDGIWYDQKYIIEGTQQWETMFKSIIYEHKLWKAQLSYRLDVLNNAKTPSWTMETLVDYTNSDADNYPDGYKQSYQNLAAKVMLAKNFSIRKSILSFNVGGCYATNLESDIFIDDNVKFKDKYTIPMFEYLTADYYSVNGRISTRIPIVGKKFPSFIGAYIEASTQRYIGDFELFNKTAFNQFGGGINYTF